MSVKYLISGGGAIGAAYGALYIILKEGDDCGESDSETAKVL